MSLLSSAVGRLRIVAFVEGISFLVLLFIAMPLKYFADSPQAVRGVGLVHGLLFVLYILAMFYAQMERKWPATTLLKVFLGSLLPFGTFWVDKRILATSERHG